MPSSTKKQAHFMAAIAHGWKPTGIKHPPSQAVAQEFHEADKREGKWEHPRKKMQLGGMMGALRTPPGVTPTANLAGGQNLAQMLAGLQGWGGGGMGGNPWGNLIGNAPQTTSLLRPPIPGGGGALGSMIGGGPGGIAAGGVGPMAGAGGPGMAGAFGGGPGIAMGGGPVPQQPATTPPSLLPPRLPATPAQPGGLGMLSRMGGPFMGGRGVMTRMADGGPVNPWAATLARLRTLQNPTIQGTPGPAPPPAAPAQSDDQIELQQALDRINSMTSEMPRFEAQRLEDDFLKRMNARVSDRDLTSVEGKMALDMLGRPAGMARGGLPPIPGMARPGLPGSLAPRTVSPLQSLISSGMAARHRGPGGGGFGVSQAMQSPYAAQRQLQRSRLSNFPA
jgi:hypothetical protein